MFDICSFYKDISVTSLNAMKTETHKRPCNPIPHCVLSAMHCHRQQSQTPADTELNSCVVDVGLHVLGCRVDILGTKIVVWRAWRSL